MVALTRAWIVLCCVMPLVTPHSAQAQSSVVTPRPPASATTKQVNPSQNHREIRSLAQQMAAGAAAAEAALTDVELEIASRVHTGLLPCELGASVRITADERAPGYFDVVIRGMRLRMFPVSSATGAVRLEDRQQGAVWLQLANKSMLMNQRMGRRMADECKSPAQAAVAEALRLNPLPSILDTPAPKPSAVPSIAPLLPPVPSSPPANAAPAPVGLAISEPPTTPVPSAPMAPASAP